VLAPKVDASIHLLDALAKAPPAALILLSSTSAVLGPPGQIDYTAANAFVAASARRARAKLRQTRVVALGFGVWRDTGMAARALRPYAPELHGERTGHPLIERYERDPNGEVRFESTYDPAQLWVLAEHRVRGENTVLPGTGIVEIVRAAGMKSFGLEPNAPVSLKDVVFLAPLEVPDGEPRLSRVLVTVDPAEPDVARVTLTSRGRSDREFVEHARGALERLDAVAPARLPIEEIEARCNARSAKFDPGRQVLPQDQQLAFGPRWRVLEHMRFAEKEAIAWLALAKEWESDLDTFRLHPGVLDIASGFAFSLADPAPAADSVRVPMSYQRLRLFAPLERELVSYVRLRDARTEDGVAVFDVTIADRAGRVLAEIEGYTTKSVKPTRLSKAQRGSREASMLERWSAQGITRAEGAEVVERLLTHAVPAELYASPTPLYELIAELGAASAGPAADAPPASIGSVKATGNGPRDDVERRLAEMWRSLLGVEEIGINDNFFELGGHSLIAVRLFARIKKAYGVDLPLAVLFQAPTIETCAEILRKELGITFAPEATKEQQPGAAARESAGDRSYAHLVHIQRGSGKVPFFCVHGAGGNVLNFRDLARQLGKEQSFIGVQARGVNGEPPAESIEEMASLYHREIKEALPNGPFFLGGYSGGGVVAYELAQRLRAEGADVPLLVFLDTFHPHAAPRKATLRERMNRLLEEGPSYISRQGKFKLTRHIEELSTELKIRFLEGNDLPLPLELREIQLTRAFVNAASRYRPKRYEGRVLLFRARMIAEIYQHMGPTLGWQDLVPGLEIVEVPGGHDSLVLEPNVQVLASHLTRAMAHGSI
jgi:thioesterase domain-containing protein/acyl carrier protein